MPDPDAIDGLDGASAPDRLDAVAVAVVRRLAEAGCVAPDAEAAELLADQPDGPELERRLARRERGEPLAWITGRVRFAGRPYVIVPEVYVPRPQTEDLARRAAARLPEGGRALDLCTGSGVLAAHLRAERPSAVVLAVDLDPLAVACARANGVTGVIGDLDACLHRGPGFDVVTAVAPYVPTTQLAFLPADVQRHEPRRALDGGDDGLALVRRVVAAAGRLRRADGHLLLEVGGEQDEALAPALDAAGFTEVEVWHDEDGDLRGLDAG